MTGVNWGRTVTDHDVWYEQLHGSCYVHMQFSPLNDHAESLKSMFRFSSFKVSQKIYFLKKLTIAIR